MLLDSNSVLYIIIYKGYYALCYSNINAFVDDTINLCRLFHHVCRSKRYTFLKYDCEVLQGILMISPDIFYYLNDYLSEIDHIFCYRNYLSPEKNVILFYRFIFRIKKKCLCSHRSYNGKYLKYWFSTILGPCPT